MAALIFLSVFIALGLAVVLVAMRGGPHGVRDTLERERAQPMRAFEFAVAGAIVVFGLVVPAAVILSDQAAAGPGGTKLSADLQEGRALFNDRCATCHALEDANAVGRVGPDLDDVVPTADLTINAIEEGRARGQGQMPARLLYGEDAKLVAEYIEEVAGR